MFGVVGNISPQQIKFPPVCPPKMFATPLDCLLKPLHRNNVLEHLLLKTALVVQSDVALHIAP